MQDIDSCLQYLKDMNVEYSIHKHEKVFNMKEMQEKVPLVNAPLVKNLFYADKKKNYHYVISKSETVVGKQFWKEVGQAPGNIRIANEEALTKVLGVQKGNVNPFAILNDAQNLVASVIYDQNLESHDYLCFHPMDNSATIELKSSDFKRFMEKINKNLKIIKLEDSDQPIEKIVEKKQEKKEEKKKVEEEDIEGTKLRLFNKKAENFSAWYQEVIQKAEFLDYYEISGCYIIRPWAFQIWTYITQFLDGKFQEEGVENCYFPMFVSERALNTEKDHVEGFSPEVAWVTKSGSSDLKEPIAIRPTSETIMYPSVSNWVKSHRDLPLKLNQWTNIVRWEFKHPTPFIRNREFLWQEGHTSHATLECANKTVYKVLDDYASVYQDLLCVPVIKGIKSENEKFAGSHFSTTVEAFICGTGRGIQGGTSHNLGQNFSKMFNIQYLDKKNEKQFCWQTSWGFTTRSIGVMIMTHGDDKGIVLPPRVAKLQVIIIPIFKSGQEATIIEKAKELESRLKKAGVRVSLDDRDNQTPGWKFNAWEMKGVPLRIEIGPNDIKKDQTQFCKRNDNNKFFVPNNELESKTKETLELIQKQMLEKAQNDNKERQKLAHTWQEFMNHLNAQNTIIAPWCKEIQCELEVKKKSALDSDNDDPKALTGSAKTLCIPLEQPELKENDVCFACQKKAECFVIWGRSY